MGGGVLGIRMGNIVLEEDDNTGSIIGGVIAGIVLLIILAGAIWCYSTRGRRQPVGVHGLESPDFYCRI